MKKLALLIFVTAFVGVLPISALAAPWQAVAPQDYKPITWVAAKGVSSFMKAPPNSGYIDYITVIHLPSTQVKLISASVAPRIDFGIAQSPFDGFITETRNWAFTRSLVEGAKEANPDVRFLWNAPFFNVTLATSDLSLGLKSSDAQGKYITSGSRPSNDTGSARRMLIVDNAKGMAAIADFDAKRFVEEGDEAVEGFDPLSTTPGNGTTARLFLGVRGGGEELVVYCSRGATHKQASDALMAAGVPLENQMQADGGGSAACGYNLPGQYFVEPGRNLTHVMGATPIAYRATVVTDNLNVRSGAGAAHAAVKQLAAGTPIIAYEEKSGWVRVGVGEWVSRSHIKKVSAVLYIAEVTTDNLNVRKGAGTSFAVTRKLALGKKVDVYEEKNGWARISDTEWVAISHIKKK